MLDSKYPSIYLFLLPYCASSRYFQQRNGRDGLHFDHGAAQHPAGHEDVPARQKAAPVRRAVF